MVSSRAIQLRVSKRQLDRLAMLARVASMSPAAIVASLLAVAVAYDRAETVERKIYEVAKSLRAKPRLSTTLRSPIRALVAGSPDGRAKVAIDRSIAAATVDLCRRSNTDMDTICVRALERWAAAHRGD